MTEDRITRLMKWANISFPEAVLRIGRQIESEVEFEYCTTRDALVPLYEDDPEMDRGTQCIPLRPASERDHSLTEEESLTHPAEWRDAWQIYDRERYQYKTVWRRLKKK